MSFLREHLERLDRRRAAAWTEILERTFPGIGDQPHRVQGAVACMPYRNPEPRKAVAVLVDGKGYVMVDGSPDLFPVVSDNGYMLHGREVRVLTISSTRWRQYFTVFQAGWTPPDAFSAALRGHPASVKGTLGAAESAAAGTRVPLGRRGGLHAVIWTVATLVIAGSAISVPAGSPARQTITVVLLLTCIGLLITSITAFQAWGQRRPS